MTRAGGQKHRQPMRRPHVGVMAGLRPLARRTGLGHVRGEGGAEGGSGADMRTSARKRDAPIFACVTSHWATGRSWSTWSEVGPGHWVKASSSSTSGLGWRGREGGGGAVSELRARWTEGEKRGHISVCTCEALCEMSSGMSFVCLVEGLE